MFLQIVVERGLNRDAGCWAEVGEDNVWVELSVETYWSMCVLMYLVTFTVLCFSLFLVVNIKRKCILYIKRNS